MTSAKTVSILLIDDHPMLRQGLIQVIELDESLTCIGEAGNGEEGVRQAISLQPDIIILDLNMRGMSGIDTLKALHNAKVRSKIIIFTVSDFQDDVIAALKAGADGYLLKDIDPTDLLEKIKQAYEGQLVISPGLVEIMANAIKTERRQKTDELEPLTPREEEILKLLIDGYSNKMIARKLDITEGTAKVHLKNILKKLNLKSRVEAAVWASKNL